MATAGHQQVTHLTGTVVSVNDHSTCCVFLGIRFDGDEKTVCVVQYRRSDDEELAASVAELDVDMDVTVTVDRYTIGTTRFVGRGIAAMEVSH